jgi:hypothetical protein
LVEVFAGRPAECFTSLKFFPSFIPVLHIAVAVIPENAQGVEGIHRQGVGVTIFAFFHQVRLVAIEGRLSNKATRM